MAWEQVSFWAQTYPGMDDPGLEQAWLAHVTRDESGNRDLPSHDAGIDAILSDETHTAVGEGETWMKRVKRCNPGSNGLSCGLLCLRYCCSWLSRSDFFIFLHIPRLWQCCLTPGRPERHKTIGHGLFVVNRAHTISDPHRCAVSLWFSGVRAPPSQPHKRLKSACGRRRGPQNAQKPRYDGPKHQTKTLGPFLAHWGPRHRPRSPRTPLLNAPCSPLFRLLSLT